ncbi:MAG: FAD:protein FMN transferase, partial [Methylomonas sp.]|nr:FAD:protein FMN transferase [Methylomonas sp.]
GWPVSHLAAVTVVADLCVIAGSASTIAMLKQQEGEDWLRSLALPYLCYSSDDSIGSEGIRI